MTIFTGITFILFLISFTAQLHLTAAASSEGRYGHHQELKDEHCSFPGAPANGIYSFSNSNNTVHINSTTVPIGTTISYSCERGFEILGPRRHICQPGGKWNPGGGIPFCVLNVAVGKAPLQSSIENNAYPIYAVDANHETCSVTQREAHPWWYVNMLEPYVVQVVRLEFGRSCCGAGNKASSLVIRVGNNRPDKTLNPICSRYTGPIERGKPLFLPCTPPMPGAFVSVHLSADNEKADHQLSICEALVYTDQALPIERCPQFRDQPLGSITTFNGKCYYFHSQGFATIREASEFCKRKNGSLLQQSSPALQGFISWELWKRHRELASPGYWLGAIRDQHNHTNWKWLNGEDILETFWPKPSLIPMDLSASCVAYDPHERWLWKPVDCAKTLNFICQFQPKTCGWPEQPANSTMSGGLEIGNTIEYKCDKGHLLIGPESRMCLPTGVFSELAPTCKQVNCGLPADIPGGGYTLLDNSTLYLSRVNYRCKEGFHIRGRETLICDIDERWDAPPPLCQPIECPEPPEIENGEVTYHNVTEGIPVDSIVEYSCVSSRYRLIGSNRLKCLSDGSYDSEPPICKEITTSSIRTMGTKLSEVTSGFGNSVTSRFVPTAPTSAAVSSTSRTPSTREKPRPFSVTSSTPPMKSATTGISNIIDDGKLSPVIHNAGAHYPSSQENDILESRSKNNANAANLPTPSLDDKKETFFSRLNIGAIVALGIFGAFVFLAATITTIVLLLKKSEATSRTKHYLHKPSPDCNTVVSYDSSSSESRVGLSRHYRQAWENLQSANSTSSKMHYSPAAAGSRKETLAADPRLESMRSGSELVLNNVFPSSKLSPEKRRHHHHHHHHHFGERDLHYHHQAAARKTRYN